MSLIYVPPAHRPLSQNCALRFDVDRPCQDELGTIQFVIPSDTARYVTYLSQSSRALGTNCNTYTPPQGEDPFYGIITCQPLANDEHYYYNDTGAPIAISSITLQADGAVGTNAGVSNAVGISSGSGMICTWEVSSNNAAASIETAEVAFYIFDEEYYEIGQTPNESATLSAATGRWLSPYSCPFTGQAPVQTPINKTWTFESPIILGTDDWDNTLKIKFTGDSSESLPSIIIAPVTVTLQLL